MRAIKIVEVELKKTIVTSSVYSKYSLYYSESSRQDITMTQNKILVFDGKKKETRSKCLWVAFQFVNFNRCFLKGLTLDPQ